MRHMKARRGEARRFNVSEEQAFDNARDVTVEHQRDSSRNTYMSSEGLTPASWDQPDDESANYSVVDTSIDTSDEAPVQDDMAMVTSSQALESVQQVAAAQPTVSADEQALAAKIASFVHPFYALFFPSSSMGFDLSSTVDILKGTGSASAGEFIQDIASGQNLSTALSNLQENIQEGGSQALSAVGQSVANTPAGQSFIQRQMQSIAASAIGQQALAGWAYVVKNKWYFIGGAGAAVALLLMLKGKHKRSNPRRRKARKHHSKRR